MSRDQLSVCAQQVLAWLQSRGRDLMKNGLGGHHGAVPMMIAAGRLCLIGWLLIVPHSVDFAWRDSRRWLKGGRVVRGK